MPAEDRAAYLIHLPVAEMFDLIDDKVSYREALLEQYMDKMDSRLDADIASKAVAAALIKRVMAL
ncbi:hypothetical protein A9R05_44475 (plasmid) [Burkholderia sp. KK1]|nr:hypothetical protein A9R05_44475 [Burkholderia sp. KK1]